MAFNILFSNDPEMDVTSLFRFINDFTVGLGEEGVQIDVEKCETLLRLMRQEFPHKLDEANVFKKVSYFMCFFISERPILAPFSEENIGEELSKMTNHQNAIVALQLAIESLHGAMVKANSKNARMLENRIELSAHSYKDIIDAIKYVMPRDDFKLMAVLLEQLVYKTNSDCQNPSIGL